MYVCLVQQPPSQFKDFHVLSAVGTAEHAMCKGSQVLLLWISASQQVLLEMIATGDEMLSMKKTAPAEREGQLVSIDDSLGAGSLPLKGMAIPSLLVSQS